MLTLTFGQGSGGAGGGLGTIFGPVEHAASRALKPARDLVNWFDETTEARGERERLTRELAESRSLAVAGKVAIEENKQLRKMTGLKAAGTIPDAYSPVTATVISRSPTVWFSTVGIDAGSNDGIEINDPVINGDGLVGHISSVNRGESVVTLITDGSSAVTAKVVPGGAQGVARPKIGDPGTLVLGFLDETKNIERGMSVVTSGWRGERFSSFYPPNIPIGEVSSAPIDQREAIQSIELEPYPDIRNFDLVQVLTGGNRG